MPGTDLATIDQTQHKPLGDDWPELLNQVQAKRWTTWPQGMQKAHLRIEAHPFRGSNAIGQKQGVEKRQQGISGVTRWAAVTCIQGEWVVLVIGHPVENVNVAEPAAPAKLDVTEAP